MSSIGFDQDKNFVVIIGSSNMDLNIYSERLPKPGETVTGGTFNESYGGKGANQAVAASRSGAKTIFVGKVGNDRYGDEMIKRLREENIDVSHVLRDDNAHSGVAFIMVDKQGENMISVAPGANHNLTPEEIHKISDLILNAKIVMAQMELSLDTVSTIFSIAAKGVALKILNPAPLRPLPEELFQNIDIIVPNKGELFRLNELLNHHASGKSMFEKIKEASENIANLGIKYVVTTLGPNGSIIYDKSERKITKIPTLEVEAIDAVGAGDCFNGVLASFLSKGKSVLKAVKYATSAASIAVTRKGAQTSMPRLSEIVDRYEELNKVIKKNKL